MYLIFNRNNGNFAALGMDGIVKTIDGTGVSIEKEIVTALENLHDGEYCYVGHFVVVRSGGGVTIGELKTR